MFKSAPFIMTKVVFLSPFENLGLIFEQLELKPKPGPNIYNELHQWPGAASPPSLSFMVQICRKNVESVDFCFTWSAQLCEVFEGF